jgi:type I restriction enzyme M protein
MINFQDKVSFIWSIAEILRGPYKPEDYGKIVLPLAVLRRFDCVLESTKEEVLASTEKFANMNEGAREPILNRVAKQNFHNTSKYDFNKLLNDSDNIADNLRDYINGFSKVARDIMDHFDFDRQIDKLDQNDLLYLTIKRFSEIDLHPEVVSNVEMGYVFEELIRRFNENAEAGDHYTPREVIRLMTHLLFLHDDASILTKSGLTQTLYDAAAGTGGMGSVAQEYLASVNPTAHLEFFGQEINPESYAICKADLLIKGEDAHNIRLGNTLLPHKLNEQLKGDHFPNDKFDYLITNPPYGVDWKSYQNPIVDEHEKQGFDGRFGPGTPRSSDGQLLFLLHLLSKMKPVTAENPQGSRLAIIMNGSPLFTGDAGSGESEIRKYVLENDLVEGIVALPNDLFYNTGIATYIWILTNNKAALSKGKVRLINAVDFSKKMKKSMGSKRNEISEPQLNEIVRLYGEFKEGENVKIFDNKDFGYAKITVERPLRLNFQVSEERIARIIEEKGFANLAASKKKGDAGHFEIEEGKRLQTQILYVLRSLQSDTVYKNREEFTKVLKDALKAANITIGTPVLKAILAGLAEKDETANVCMKNKTDIEPDSDLRDTESVPLKENIHEYFAREVLPYVPDAWIDETKIKIGYEIPFTRQFYKYTALRSSAEIMDEIRELEVEIAEMLKKVIG